MRQKEFGILTEVHTKLVMSCLTRMQGLLKLNYRHYGMGFGSNHIKLLKANKADMKRHLSNTVCDAI